MDHENEEIRVFYAGDSTVYFSKQQFHWFENQKPFVYYL